MHMQADSVADEGLFPGACVPFLATLSCGGRDPLPPHPPHPTPVFLRGTDWIYRCFSLTATPPECHLLKLLIED